MLLSTILEAVSYVPGLAAIAAAIAVIGAGMGIGKIGQSAMEAMARQPEAADGIRSSSPVLSSKVQRCSPSSSACWPHSANQLCETLNRPFDELRDLCFYKSEG